jgi:hypothetical protein
MFKDNLITEKKLWVLNKKKEMRLVGKRHLDPILLFSFGLKLNHVRVIPMWFKWLDQFKNNLNDFFLKSKDEVEIKKIKWK